MKLSEHEDALWAAHERLSEVLDETEPDGFKGPGENQIVVDAAKAVEDAMLGAVAKRDACGAFLRKLDADIEFLEAEEKRVAKIRRRAERARERFRGYVQFVMETRQIEKLKGETTTFTLVQNPEHVEVGVSADLLPAEFVREVPAFREPDKRSIKEALKLGMTVPGCRLVPGEKRLKVS